ncbi:ATP-grasp domain-containing protein [Aquicoccus sp. SCR17]|nr:ATP-grasp domain-containing protein [Carideicomes alvinocaridis]
MPGKAPGRRIGQNMTRLLIANRGEIACRIIHAARKLGLRTVSVFSEADWELPHVALADQSVCLGPAAARESYLDAERLIAAAKETGCTLVHPGYGFLSENAAFARRCEEAGLTFVGPSADHIELMGDKQNARDAAIAAGVPVLPGSGRLGTDEGEIAEQGRQIGYPLLVKATAGGGGQGMQRVETAEKLLSTVTRTRDFAKRVFGDGSVYLERCLTGARHVEVQVFGLGPRGALHCFERDCSLQRRHQKVIEEAPAPDLPDELRARMTEASRNLATSLGYRGAGTVEYLFEPASGEFFFLEMNTRIQVEHPVTEAITGLDLVAAQLRLALDPDSDPLPSQQDISATGASIEARVYAENPEKRFLPSPGRIDALELPQVEGVTYHSGYVAGNEVTVHYDPMILKVVASGADREAARKRLLEALGGMVLTGVTNNARFLSDLLENEAFVRARFDTGTIAASKAG